MPLHHIRPATASPAYWADRKAALKLIKALETAIARCKSAPQYIGLVENMGPWNTAAQLRDEARVNPTVVEILTAQRHLELLGS